MYPRSLHLSTSYYGNSEFDNYPVIYVNRDQALTYCEWRGGGLPTEAQWEKAARGTSSRTFPWGEEIDCNKANYCESDTVSVGNYEDGMSPYGIYDLAGNVSEWVADWYSSTYYQNSTSINPIGPISGQYGVLRGGSWWENGGDSLRVFERRTLSPLYNYYNYYVGFRCAMDANP